MFFMEIDRKLTEYGAAGKTQHRADFIRPVLHAWDRKLCVERERKR